MSIIWFFSCSEDKHNPLDNEDQSVLHPVETPDRLIGDSVFSFCYYSDSSIFLNLKVYTPQRWAIGAERPCIVYFHGGAEDDSQYKKQCKHFSERGLVAFSVNHRFHNKYFYNKIGLKDGHAALRWIKKNAGELGIDTTKVAVGGSSAGAAVALSCYLLPKFNHKTDNLASTVCPDIFVLANPQLIDMLKVPKDASDHPPTLFFQGDNDNLTPLSDLEKYCSDAQKAGAPEIRLKLYPGRGHGFFNFEVSPDDFFNTLYTADSFLVEKGYLTEYF